MTLSPKLESFSEQLDISDQIFSNVFYPSAAFPKTSQPLGHQIYISLLAITPDETHSLYQCQKPMPWLRVLLKSNFLQLQAFKSSLLC